MLSPGQYYKQIPKAVPENLEYRRALLSWAGASTVRHAVLKERCREDVLYYVNAMVWTFRPKDLKKRVVPFVTWECQDDAILGAPAKFNPLIGRLMPPVKGILPAIEKQKDLVGEKSRDMGFSWLAITTCEWLGHFHDWTQALLISRVAELVDSSSPDSLFWKMRFIHRLLPWWLRPKVNRKQMFFEYTETNSTTTGQATTEKAGVGGRATVMVIDEYSRIPKDFEVLEGTKDTADCRIFISTHTNQGTAFHKLCTNGVTDKLVLHWTQHPEKARGAYLSKPDGTWEPLDREWHDLHPDFTPVCNGLPAGGPFPGIRSPWYDNQCIERGSQRDVATNLDIDVKGASSKVFDRIAIILHKEKHKAEPLWTGDVEYERDSARPVRLVQKENGLLKLWLRPDAKGRPPSDRYAFGCDVSQGTGATPSCGSGWSSFGEKILEYANGLLRPEPFADLMVALARLFCDERGQGGLLAWEYPGPGVTFGKRVIELGYGNIYYRKNELQIVPQEASVTPGWFNSQSTQRLLLEQYAEALYSEKVINHSEDALEELFNFDYGPGGSVVHARIQSEDDPSGAGENHGDMAQADAIGCKMIRIVGLRTPERRGEESPPAGCIMTRRRQSVQGARRRIY